LQVIVGWNPEAFYDMLGERTRKSLEDRLLTSGDLPSAAAAAAAAALVQHQVIVGWNPEAFYAMLGERTRKSLEDPATRINNRRMMQPGFTKEALAGYMDKVWREICMLNVF
jgi:hypothetical protein